MPAPQSSPGPSTLITATDILQPHNAKKRANSEIPPEEESRQPKKHRKELEAVNGDEKAVVSASSLKDKDGKKKRKKKKRKSPLTIPEIDIELVVQAPANNVGGTVPLSMASSTTLSDGSVPSPVTAIAPVPVKEEPMPIESLQNAIEEEDEKPAISSVDKGKGKAASEFPDNMISLQDGVAPAAGLSHESESLKAAQDKIAELTAQLQAQKTLLSRHEDNLSHLQQSLTCEICLDLLYKPFALSPCGHVACYLCLIRWFTSLQNNGNGNDNNNVEPPAELVDVTALLNSRHAQRGAFLHNKKTCPLCRTNVYERPAEVWSVKSMVANLIKSKLVDLPSEPPPSATETPPAGGSARVNARNDPWRNVFPRIGRRSHHLFHPQYFPAPPENAAGDGPDAGWGVEEMGMYDAEDGGIYRCIDCMHEIWGGVCSQCHREYPGHARFEDDDDENDDEDDEVNWIDDGDDLPGLPHPIRENFLGRRLREIWAGYGDQALGWGGEEDEDEDDEDMDGPLEYFDAYGDPMQPSDDDDEESLSEEQTDFDNSEGEWSTDDDDDDDYPPLMHHGLPILPNYRRGRRAIDPLPAAHIEEIDPDDHGEEEEEDESDHDSEYHSHPESEGEYEGSFIDDGDEDHDVDDDDDDDDDIEVRVHQGPAFRRRHQQIVEAHPAPLQQYDEDEPEPEGHGFRGWAYPGRIARHLGRVVRLGGRGHGDDDVDLPPPVPAPGPQRNQAHRNRAGVRGRGGGRARPIVVEDGEDDEGGVWEDENNDDDDEVEVVGASNAGTRRRQRIQRRGLRPVVLDDIDEDDEEDGEEEGQEIRPSGSRRGNARAGPSTGRARRSRRPVYDEESELD